MEIVGRDLNVDIDFLNLVGSAELPRLTVELNLQVEDIPKLIDYCDIPTIGRSDQMYRVIIEEVKPMRREKEDNITEEIYDMTEDDVKRFKKIAEEELKKKGF